MCDEDDGGGGEGAPAWMATFADMMSLLLTFFVLLLSFANMDVQYFQLALGSVKHALGVKSKRPGYMQALTTKPIEWDHEGEESDDSFTEDKSIVKIESLIRQQNLRESVKLEVNDESIVLKVYGLFAPGSAELDPRKFDELSLMVEVCNTVDQPIRVEAHTDNRPIRTRRFASNWELSAVRAGAVTRYLIESGVEDKRLSAAGLAYLRPVTTNDTAKGRAENRRVAVVITRKRNTDVQNADTEAWR